MKTYSSAKESATKRKKLVYLIAATVALAVLAVTITLAAVLGASGTNGDVDVPVQNPIGGEPDEPVVKPEPITYALPVAGSIVRVAALEELTYMPSLNMWKTHNGVDFAAEENAPVAAIAAGVVETVEVTTLEGTVVTLRHDGGLTSTYKSLGSASVAVGDTVAKGDTLGTAGTMLTEHGDGVHVHIELRLNGELADPLEYLDVDVNK